MDAAAKPPARLSLLERLRLAVKLTTIAPLMLALNLARFVLLALRSRLPLRRYAMCGAIRTLFASFSNREIQHLVPPTRKTYDAWIARAARRTRDPVLQQRLVGDVQLLEGADGAAILWIGDRRRAHKLVLFLHGGGFIVPLLPSHLEWCWNVYVRPAAADGSGAEVAVGVLQYTLHPAGGFPVQLRQAAAALGALLDAGARPSDVVVGGDSAGGNLTMQLLGHLVHPHDGARRIELAEPLAGAFLVSPWLACTTSTRAFRDNAHSDMLSTAGIQSLNRAYFGGAAGIAAAVAGGNRWAAPLDGPEAETDAWLRGVDGVVVRLYVTVGGREILADQGIGLVAALKRVDATCEVRLDETADEAHDFILFEGREGVVGDATRRMQDWFQAVVKTG